MRRRRPVRRRRFGPAETATSGPQHASVLAIPARLPGCREPRPGAPAAYRPLATHHKSRSAPEPTAQANLQAASGEWTWEYHAAEFGKPATEALSWRPFTPFVASGARARAPTSAFFVSRAYHIAFCRAP